MAAKIDYTAALKMAGETDPEKASGLFKLVDMLNKMSGWLAFLGIDVKAELKKLVAKYVTDRKKADKTAPAPAAPPADSPAPASPSPAPVPTPAPTAPGPTLARRITTIVAAYYWIAADNKTYSNADRKAKLSREDPIVPGDRAAINASPYDQFGTEIASDGQEGVDRPGFTGKNWTPELDAAMWYPDGSSRLRWFVEGGIGRITGGTHQRGFTPKVKHDEGSLGKNEEGELGVIRGVYTAPDGTVINVNPLPSLRAKG